MKKAIFLHGFYASGSCPMAEALRESLNGTIELLTPDLPLHPQDALNYVRQLCLTEHPDILIGNSNGAFLAQILATELNTPALLGNPHLKMSEFVSQRIGRNHYKYPRKDGNQEFIISPSLADEFSSMELHQWDNWKLQNRDLCIGLFGEKDTLARFESLVCCRYNKIFHFPGDHTPTNEEVKSYYTPLILLILNNQK